jgi:oligopeptide/dipeptide ABC transporter ATP-binding protein
MTAELLLVKRLSVSLSRGSYLQQRGYFRAVDGVSFHLDAGEFFGLLGESGSGKTTLGKAVAGIIRPERGEILFGGEPVLPGKFSPHLQMVFQDPYGSLNPRLKIRTQLLEGPRNYRLGKREEREERLKEILAELQLPPGCLDLYPQALSGGQKQRAALARAILTRPQLLILDEPTSSLDGIARSMITDLLGGLQRKHHLSALVISHDLPALKKLCRRVAVMYLGKLVETGTADRVFTAPAHYCTRVLLDAYLPPRPEAKRFPVADSRKKAGFLKIPLGCRFHPRCPKAAGICRTMVPPLRRVSGEHYSACHRAL